MILTNIKQLIGIQPSDKYKSCGHEMNQLNLIENAYLKIDNGLISDFGEMNSLTIDNNVEVNNITYEYYLQIVNTINLNKINSCLTSIFNIEQGNLKDDIKMRFKRVSNFNESDAIESYIIDLLKDGISNEDIIKIIKG